ncbi:MAG: cation-translocating P-type ATPase [Bacteroidota bacterium]
MPDPVIKLDHIAGLTARQIPELQQQFGKNTFAAGPTHRLIYIIGGIVKEPMFLLLLVACSLYFILGETGEGLMMLAAVIFVAAISLFQEIKSTNAVKALQQLAEPRIMVIRDSKEMIIAAEELVPGDIFILEEGMNVPADAVVLQANDFSVNESVITGESIPADKNETAGKNFLYQGTTVNSGKTIARVTATGNNTVLGKLGKVVGNYNPGKTLLQLQLNRFLRFFVLFGIAGFIIVFLMNFLQDREWTTSLLFSLTLAMSAVPEEIPVAFSSFMALGAYKMSKLGIISRQPQVVESVGAVSVFCFDKTGTITENKMQLKTIYDYNNDKLIELASEKNTGSEKVLRFAVLASETDPFDTMEKAIWEAYKLNTGATGSRLPQMIFEYPLEGKPPMMTHVYEQDNARVVAAKGAPERITNICRLGDNDKKRITKYTLELASKGYRVLGVASALHTPELMPERQDDFEWQFEGLLALYDPPKTNVRSVLEKFYQAKINVKLITGDYRETAVNIAGQAGIANHQRCMNGDEVLNMSAEELKRVVMHTNVFARMFPDAKLKVIEALKANGEIVAMTGDGVNDGPALKSANIGIAMGQRGTEIARQASDLVLTDDNLEKLVTAVSEGRRIFNNLKKAIRYIISIHIPIILTASLPLLFGWTYPNIFTPVHVIFLELIMGPTCSVFFEREPVEEDLMLQAPRIRTRGIFTGNELLISTVQGIIIAIGILLLYYYFMRHGKSLEETRTIVFTTLILSNVFLTFANRSFTKTMYYTSRYKNNLAALVLIVSALFLVALHLVPAVRNLFQLVPITPGQFWLCIGVAFSNVMWFEVYKTGVRKLKM